MKALMIAGFVAACVAVAGAAAAGPQGPAPMPGIARQAAAAWRAGALDRAAALRRQALATAIAASGCESPAAGRAMVQLGRVDLDRQRYLDAEPLFIIAARVLGGSGHGNAPVFAAIDTGLARIALARGKLRHAEAWARRAVALARHGTALRVLGAVLTAERRFGQAETVLREALARDRVPDRRDGVEVARDLAQLAHLYLRWGRAKAALPLIEEAGAIDQARLGPGHPLIADNFYDLGLVEAALGRPGLARRAVTTAIAVLQRGSERHTPRVAYALLELSRLDYDAGQEKAAEAAFDNARRILDTAEAEERRRERTA